MIKELLPLPLTPVMQVKVPRGMDASISFRLLWRAPRMISAFPLPERRADGPTMLDLPPKYAPVRLSWDSTKSSTDP